MNIKTTQKVQALKMALENKVKEMIDYINSQYEQTDLSGGFASAGQSAEIKSELQNAKSKHLAFLKNIENRINTLFLKIDETMAKVHFTNEKTWLKNLEIESEKLITELNGLK